MEGKDDESQVGVGNALTMNDDSKVHHHDAQARVVDRIKMKAIDIQRGSPLVDLVVCSCSIISNCKSLADINSLGILQPSIWWAFHEEVGVSHRLAKQLRAFVIPRRPQQIVPNSLGLITTCSPD